MDLDTRSPLTIAKEAAKRALYNAKQPSHLNMNDLQEENSASFERSRRRSTTPHPLDQALQAEQDASVDLSHILTDIPVRHSQGLNSADLQARDPQELAEKIVNNPDQWFATVQATTKFVKNANATIHRYRNQRNEAREKVTELTNNLRGVDLTSKETLRHDLEQARSELRDEQESHANTLTDMDALRGQLDDVEKDLADVQASADPQGLVSQYRQDAAKLREDLAEARGDVEQALKDNTTIQSNVDKYRASYEQYQSAYTKLADKVTDKTAEHHQRLAEKDAIIAELEKRLRTGAREPNNSSLQSQTQPLAGPTDEDLENLFTQPSGPRGNSRTNSRARPQEPRELTTSHRQRGRSPMAAPHTRNDRPSPSRHGRRDRSSTYHSGRSDGDSAGIRWPDPEHFTGEDKTKYKKWCSDIDAKLEASYPNASFERQIAYVKTRTQKQAWQIIDNHTGRLATHRWRSMKEAWDELDSHYVSRYEQA